ncbi:MAG TPA: HAMP domain-containing sensor histidine kinase [Steroidobacteraceae bacterium]|nr:HAMP domain-containing sensor histidine kinase [Steroidobacteraceae bacterium]
MRWALPKSLNGFLLLGLAIIAIPLLVAVVHATVQMTRLTGTTQKLVLESVQATRLTRDLFSQIASLERSARLYQVLGTPQVLATFRGNDEQLDGTVQSLRVQLGSAEASADLARLSELQAQVRSEVPALANTTTQSTGLEAFGPLQQQAARVAELANHQIDTELKTLRTQTTQARGKLLLEAALMIPLLLLAVLAFTIGLGRPLRQIDRAITELGNGSFTHAIDVTGPVDLQRLGRQLEWLRLRLVELAQERNRFLRHMSHELKTPLANIREGTELLMDGAVGELGSGQREVTTILQDNSIKLQRMIENLLSFSAWQSNSIGLDPSEFRLRPLVKQVLENQQLTLVSQRLRLDVHVENLLLYADRGKVRLILENLLSNAIKYSPRGGAIHLRARATGDELTLEIADSGVGIAPDERAHIFDAFYTGRSPSGHVKGTGIGLSVVHEFVQVHGGSITLRDGEFAGAHFCIRMPLRANRNAPLPGLPERGAAPERNKANAA